MAKGRMLRAAILGIVLLLGGSSGASAGAEAALGQQGQGNMPLLRGDTWQAMDQDKKAAFLWGVFHVVSIEQELMRRYPELKRDSFVTKVVEGMAGVPLENAVRAIDQYYAAHPDKINLPVIMVMWKEMILPNIKTGIAGAPLQRK